MTFNVDIFVNLYGRVLKFIEFLERADFVEGEEAECNWANHTTEWDGA